MNQTSQIKRGPILSHFLHTAALIAAIFVFVGGRAFATDVDYSGHYDLAKTKMDRTFSLEVKQTGQRATISFIAAMENGSGPAPIAAGTGRVKNGQLVFGFKDNFKNEGTCTLQSEKDGYHLNMTLTELVDANAVHFYGNMLLKKAAN